MKNDLIKYNTLFLNKYKKDPIFPFLGGEVENAELQFVFHHLEPIILFHQTIKESI